MQKVPFIFTADSLQQMASYQAVRGDEVEFRDWGGEIGRSEWEWNSGMRMPLLAIRLSEEWNEIVPTNESKLDFWRQELHYRIILGGVEELFFLSSKLNYQKERGCLIGELFHHLLASDLDPPACLTTTANQQREGGRSRIATRSAC